MDRDETVAFMKVIVEKYSKLPEWGKRSILEQIPKAERRYKCHTCHTVFDAKYDENGYAICANCGETHVEIMCPLDHCQCSHEIISGIVNCPMCGEYICPECGTHDVSAVSRVTGYLSDPTGWHAGKKQELKDRHRVNIPETMT